jgi:hypothetical protein
VKSTVSHIAAFINTLVFSWWKNAQPDWSHW